MDKCGTFNFGNVKKMVVMNPKTPKLRGLTKCVKIIWGLD